MDPLSDILSLLKPRNYMAGGFEVGGRWAIRFNRHEGIKCYSVVTGECWLAVEGVADPVHLTTGDSFILPRGWPFRIGSDLETTPIDASEFFSVLRETGLARFNGGGGFLLVGGHFLLTGRHADLLLGDLSPIVHIRKESDRAALRWSIERMIEELRAPEPGSALVAQNLAYLMLIQALRLHLANGSSGGTGWLFALADEQIGSAITAMHREPAHRWTLQELGARIGMSRSTFALKFKQTVGMPAMDYLTRWRMLLAGDRLLSTGESIAAIAWSLGYESESAFCTAFKRVMGCSPRQYGRQ